MFRRNITSAIADLPLRSDGNSENQINRYNLSAKGCPPEKGCLPCLPKVAPMVGDVSPKHRVNVFADATFWQKVAYPFTPKQN
jgi:hypothetical protein